MKLEKMQRCVGLYLTILRNKEVKSIDKIDKYNECKPLLNKLMIEPGIYITENCIQDNFTALLSSIAWIHTHGNRDDGLPYFKLKEKAKHSKLFLTCGYISKFTHEILDELGIKIKNSERMYIS